MAKLLKRGAGGGPSRERVKTFLSAAADGKLDVVRASLDKHGERLVNEADAYGKTALMWAAIEGRNFVARELVAHAHVDVDARDENGCTALHFAADRGHELIVNVLLDNGGASINATNAFGNTPLHQAAFFEKLSTVELLLACGADSTMRNRAGKTPRDVATEKNAAAVVQALANARTVTKPKTPPSSTAATAAATAAASFSSSLLAVVNAFVIAARDRRVDAMRELLERHGDTLVDRKNSSGETALMLAAFKGNVDVVRFLVVEKRANVEEKNSAGRTALDIAADRGRDDVVELLLVDGGANANVQDAEGWTPLHSAARRNRVHTVAKLLSHGADRTIKNASGDTAATRARKKNRIAMAEFIERWVPGASVPAELDAAAAVSTASAADSLMRSSGTLGFGGDDGVNSSSDQTSTRPPDRRAANKTTGSRPASQSFGNGLLAAAVLHKTGASSSGSGGGGGGGGGGGAEAGWSGEAMSRASIARDFSPADSGIGVGSGDISRSDADTGDATLPSNAEVTALLESAYDNNMARVRALCGKYGKRIVNKRNKTGVTALMWAAYRNHTDVVAFLVGECSARVDQRDNAGRTALDVAAEQGHNDVVTLLLHTGHASIDSQDNNGWTALHTAATKGVESTVRLLLSCGADRTLVSTAGETAAQRARRKGQSMIADLIDARASSTSSSFSGSTEVLTKGRSSSGSKTSLTLNRVRNDSSSTPVADGQHSSRSRSRASTPPSTASVDLSTQRSGPTAAQVSMFLDAAFAGKLDVVESLIGIFGAHIVDVRDSDGFTALAWAAIKKHYSLLDFLVCRAHADVTLRNVAGRTALDLAAERGHVSVLRTLVERGGADVNAVGPDGFTPLHAALLLDDDAATVKELLSLGADPTLSGPDGQSAIDRARVNNRDAVSRLLADSVRPSAKGGKSTVTPTIADVATASDDVITGASPTQSDVDEFVNAAGAGDVERCIVLRERFGGDAIVERRSAGGETALTASAARGHIDVVRDLLRSGKADASRASDGGWLPLHLAARYGHARVIAVLLTDGGADVDGTGPDDYTALHLAARGGHDYAAESLLFRGADKSARTAKHKSAVDIALEKGHTAVAKLIDEFDCSLRESSSGDKEKKKKNETAGRHKSKDTHDDALLTTSTASNAINPMDSEAELTGGAVDEPSSLRPPLTRIGRSKSVESTLHLPTGGVRIGGDGGGGGGGERGGSGSNSDRSHDSHDFALLRRDLAERQFQDAEQRARREHDDRTRAELDRRTRDADQRARRAEDECQRLRGAVDSTNELVSRLHTTLSEVRASNERAELTAGELRRACAQQRNETAQLERRVVELEASFDAKLAAMERQIATLTEVLRSRRP